MKVAVIGGGIGGLSCAWWLTESSDHVVTIYEANKRLGLDSQAVEIENSEGQRVGIDLPLRVFSETYYPNLVNMYKEIGVKIIPENYATSFNLVGQQVFRYSNWLLGGLSIPYVTLSTICNSNGFAIVYDFVKFKYMSKYHLSKGLLKDVTLGDYLKQYGYSDVFVHKIIVPIMAGICTCSYDGLLKYPAEIIVAYIQNRSMYGVRRAMNGTKEVVTMLTKSVPDVRLESGIEEVTPVNGKVEVKDVHGKVETYDHVIIASQAHRARKMLSKTADMLDEYTDILSRYPYESAQALVHTDPGLMPDQKSEWAPANLFMSDHSDKPSITVWMNKAHPDMHLPDDIFESWNPHKTPEEDRVLATSYFDRPLLTLESVEATRRLEKINGKDNIWFCGSYSLHGMPLLENAVTSGLYIAEKLTGKSRPWSETPVELPRDLHHAVSFRSELVALATAVTVVVGGCVYVLKSR
eukprot:GFYU01012948.1.p1 GENE.GFYU01012948.1~~GFYU01012948.1.p1  ORF type:complete len:466 (+),score=114.24 GFYU01012948.1:184-1581(+)